MEGTKKIVGSALGKIFGGALVECPVETVAHCPKHGEYHSKQIFKRATPVCPHCNRERLAAESEAMQREFAEHNRRQAEILRRQALCETTDIPPRFADKTVKGWLPQTAAEKNILAGVVAYAKGLKDGNAGALVLHGNVGTGKTHIGCALLSMLKRDMGGSVQYLTVGDFFRKIRESKNFKADANESAVLDFYENVDLLAVDEVGNQTGSDAERVLLCELLNRRYAKMKPTIVISNLDGKELPAFLGTVVWERLIDGGIQLYFDGESRRKPLAWGNGA